MLDFGSEGTFLFQALLFDVVLQIADLFRHCDDSLSEGEIIPFSGVSKSGAGSIAHAAGIGRSIRGASGVELQPTLASSNIALKLIDSGFGISQFSSVFSIQCSDITLARLHVFDGGARKAELFGSLIALVFVGYGVVAVVVHEEHQHADYRHHQQLQPVTP